VTATFMVRTMLSRIVAGLRATSTLVSIMPATSAADPTARAIQPKNGVASSAADSPMAAVMKASSLALVVIALNTSESAQLAIAEITSSRLIDLVTALWIGPSAAASSTVSISPTIV
jgi:hypothetical protein